jgi:hypothetical protein
MCGVELERRIFDKVVHEVDCYYIPRQLLQTVLSPFLWIGTVIDSFHRSGKSSLFRTELKHLFIADSNILFLLESVLTHSDHYLAIYTFSTLQYRFQSQVDWHQVLIVQPYIHTSICLTSMTSCTLNSFIHLLTSGDFINGDVSRRSFY